MTTKDIISMDAKLKYHLQYNHYPPIDLVFMDIAKEAIELAKEEKWNTVLELPNKIKKEVCEIIEDLHLDWFLEPSEDEILEDD